LPRLGAEESRRPAKAVGLVKFLDHVRKYDRAWLCTGRDIAEHWRRVHPPSQIMPGEETGGAAKTRPDIAGKRRAILCPSPFSVCRKMTLFAGSGTLTIAESCDWGAAKLAASAEVLGESANK
jgi:hypothetical protein